jgi:hypothetical protein
MTYSVGGLIQAADYNTFREDLNEIWGSGVEDNGWGQTELTGVSAGGIVTATNWASLVNTLATAGSQTNTTLTARTAPVTGSVIAVLSNLATDISSVNSNRGNTPLLGPAIVAFAGTTSKTTSTGAGTAAWTIQFNHTVTFTSASQARYFWNAGGFVQIAMNKTSTGNGNDSAWNTFIGTIGTLILSGRVNNASQVIQGATYTGFTRFGGSGTPSPNLTTTGWFTLTPGTLTSMFQLNNPVFPYTTNFVRVIAQRSADSTLLNLTTTWYQDVAGYSTTISGGTETTSPFGAYGTAPTVIVLPTPPSTTYLTNSWGTPTVTASVI